MWQPPSAMLKQSRRCASSYHDDGLTGLHVVVSTVLPPRFAPAGGPCLRLAAEPALAVLQPPPLGVLAPAVGLVSPSMTLDFAHALSPPCKECVHSTLESIHQEPLNFGCCSRSGLGHENTSTEIQA